VDNNYADVQLGGDLRLIGTASVPALSGRAEIRRVAGCSLVANIYSINEAGTIDFSNPPQSSLNST
jgi:hypothetical protein